MSENANLKSLADRMADGTATQAEAARLSALLRNQPELRDAYTAYLDTHALLAWEFRSEVAGDPTAQTIPAPPITINRPFAAWLPWSLTVAALTVAAVALWRSGRSEPNPIAPVANSSPTAPHVAQPNSPADSLLALVVDEAGAKFAAGRAPQGVGIRAGDYELVEGVVHFRFTHGADLVLAAPARLSITDLAHAHLAYGSIRVIAPPTAAGFTIVTPAAQYIDLGTEFGLRVNATDGASDLHVFDGQVNVGDTGSGKILSEEIEGNSSRYVRGRATSVPELKASDFPDPAAIGFARWREYEQRMTRERGLRGFYPFRRQVDGRTVDDHTLANTHVDHAAGDGRIHGARWASGRWPGKDALLFDRDDDYVELDISGELSQLTIAAWIKVDRLDFELNAILNTNLSPTGGMHFQLTRQGLPRGGVLGTKCRDDFVGRPVPLGEWSHVAMVIDSDARSQKFYVNGELSRTRPQLAHAVIRPGTMRLGNWLPAVNGFETPRALRGRVDELAIWNRALTEKELAELIEAGRPGRLWNTQPFESTTAQIAKP
jgi:hypothetical protein